MGDTAEPCRTEAPIIATLTLGDLGPRLPDVTSIAVLRGGGIGDLMFVLPAVEALAAAYPQARLTLLGMPSHAALLAERPDPFAVVDVLPGHPGVREGTPVDASATEAFCARMRERRFDLAVQAHGGGTNANPFLLRLGARHTVGTGTPDATPLELTLPYRYYQHEAHRWLEVVGLVGAPPVQLEARLRRTRPPRPREPGPPRLVIHPGATDPRRRWPADRFAAVARAAVAAGVEVIVVGDRSDSAAGAEVTAVAPGTGPGRVTSMVDELTLPALVDLLASADVVVANDSGPRHLAMAVGTATVGIFWAPNLINAGPLGRRRHRVHLGWTLHCPVCGIDCSHVGWTAPRCEHDVSFVADVPSEPVLADVTELLAAPASPR